MAEPLVQRTVSKGAYDNEVKPCGDEEHLEHTASTEPAEMKRSAPATAAGLARMWDDGADGAMSDGWDLPRSQPPGGSRDSRRPPRILGTRR